MRDGLARAETRTVLLSTTTSGTTASQGASFGAVQTNIIGSPSTLGAFVQAGSGVTSAGSTAGVSYGVQFTTRPFFLALGTSGATANNPLAQITGSRSASGTAVISVGPGVIFDWIAVGQV